MKLFFLFLDAKLWKEAFDKAKKIVETECEAYSGKPTSDESETESSSSDDEDEPKLTITDVTDEKVEADLETAKVTDDVTADLAKLQVEDKK